MAPTVVTSAPNLPAFSTSTFICQSIPGNGRVSSINVRPSVCSNISLIFWVAIRSSSQLLPFKRKCTGLELTGPLANSSTSIFIPGIFCKSASSSAITRFPSSSGLFFRLSQGMVSNCIWPMVSFGDDAPAVFWFNPPAPANAKTLSTPGWAKTIFSASFTISSFSWRDRLPLART